MLTSNNQTPPQDNNSEQTPPQDNNSEQTPRQNENLNRTLSVTPAQVEFLDKFFIVVTGLGFSGGTILAILFYFFPSICPIIPSIFFGSAISSLVYRFMGGIRPEDGQIKLGDATLKGTIASLFVTIFFLNMAFEKQLKFSNLLIAPQEQDLIAINRNGEPVKVIVESTKESTRVIKTIKLPDEVTLEALRERCGYSEGICSEKEREVKFEKTVSVPQGFAALCINQRRFNGYPLLIFNEERKTPIPVRAYATAPCQDSRAEPMLIKINPGDAQKAQVSSKGFVGVAPLIEPIPPEIYIRNLAAAQRRGRI